MDGHTTRTTNGATCPRCGSPSLPVLYGYPDATAWEIAEAGLAVLGGCVVDVEVNRVCVGAGHGFLGPEGSWDEVEAALATLKSALHVAVVDRHAAEDD